MDRVWDVCPDRPVRTAFGLRRVTGPAAGTVGVGELVDEGGWDDGTVSPPEGVLPRPDSIATTARPASASSTVAAVVAMVTRILSQFRGLSSAKGMSSVFVVAPGDWLAGAGRPGTESRTGRVRAAVAVPLAPAVPSEPALPPLRAALASEAAVGYRSAGSFASARRTRSRTCSGTSAGSSGGSSVTCRSAISSGVLPVKGAAPARQWCATAPSA